MNRTILKAIMIMTIFSVLCGCSSYDVVGVQPSGKIEMKIVKSEDGKMQLSVPSNWNSKDSALSKGALIKVSSRSEEKYVIVINDTKDNFDDNMTLNNYYSLVKDNMKNSIKDCVLSKTSNKVINGLKCKVIILKGSVSKVKIVYWLNVIETKNSFVQVIGWTLLGKEKDNYEEMMKVINSFKYKV